MTDVGELEVRRALAGDRAALDALVRALTPIIQARVVRGLARWRRLASGRDARQEIGDMTQDVFAALFAHDGRALRAWAPERGLSLANFVGLVAERHVASMLRSGRRNPWRDIPEERDRLDEEPEGAPLPADVVGSRQELERLLDRLRESLSPRGLELFHRLYVREEPVDEVGAALAMTREAIYAWRSRVTKLLATLAAEMAEDAASDRAGSRRTPREGSDGG